MFEKSESNLASRGAEWAWKPRRAGVDLLTQLASLKVVFGAVTSWSSTAKVLSLIKEGSQTLKQVGYPYQLLFGLDGSPR